MKISQTIDYIPLLQLNVNDHKMVEFHDWKVLHCLLSIAETK